jgi:Meiotically Up-regulated Gene 113 (MUG113) protein/uncharacterized protein DUF4041
MNNALGSADEARGYEAEVVRLRHELAELKREVIETTDAMMLQEVGIYRYSHPLDSAAAFKDRLEQIEKAIADSIKKGTAVSSTKKWVINGSEKEGLKMVNDFSKLILRSYNNEADNIIRTLKPYALDSAIQRLEKQRASIAKLGASMKLEVTDGFNALRIDELRLTADYLAKVAEEREKEREAKAKLREEEKAQRELEAETERLQKEQQHYANVAEALRAKGDVAAASDAEERFVELQQMIDGVAERAANIRAGYVYVISNIGAFGQRMVKVGLTRRLVPMDRIRELGDASVPFRFDVHALIFSDDAVGLETELHREFASRRVNLVNAHREFFYITPQDVKTVLLRLRGEMLTYTDEPEAIEWRQSESSRAPS